MKKIAMLSMMLIWAVPASATVYNDATGDLADPPFTGFSHLDIASVEVSNTATDISFAITLVGDIFATDWGNYMIIIDSQAGGDAVGNGWGRPISMPSGADHWIGSWVNSGNGAQRWDYDGANWNQLGAPSIITTSNSATVTLPLADIGVTLGGSFEFDVFSSGSGGGDGAVDSLGNPGEQIADWGDQSDAFSQTYVTPEPVSISLLAIGGVLALRRRRS